MKYKITTNNSQLEERIKKIFFSLPMVPNRNEKIPYWGSILFGEKSIFKNTDFADFSFLGSSIHYNQALFIVLGLDYKKATTNYKKIFIYGHPYNNKTLIDIHLTDNDAANMLDILFNSREHIEVKEFLKWAMENGFLKKPEAEPLPPQTKEKLYKLLKNNKLITGNFNDKWQWIGQRNQLAYLAKRLKQKGILTDSCHQELSFYILDKNPTRKPLRNIENPAQKKQKVINTVVNDLI